MSNFEFTHQLCSLLLPSCQLYESCQLWREYLRCQISSEFSAPLDSTETAVCPCCKAHCGGPSHWRQRERSSIISASSNYGSESLNGETKRNFRRLSERRAATSRISSSRQASKPLKDEDSSDASRQRMRQESLDGWHERKAAELKANRAASAQKKRENEAKRSEADQKKTEEGQAAYQSWIQQKRKSGWSKAKNTQTADNGQEEAEKKKAANEAAIEKWRSEKTTQQIEQRRIRLAQESEAKAAKEAEEEDRRSLSASKRDAWEKRKKQELQRKRQSRLEAEQLAAEEKRQAEERKRESARLRYEEWCAKKDDHEEESAKSEGQRVMVPWRPNTTVRRK